MENSVEVEILSICWTVAEVKISFFPSYFFGLKNMLRSVFFLVIHYWSEIVVWKCVCCNIICNFLYSIIWQRYQTWIIIWLKTPIPHASSQFISVLYWEVVSGVSSGVKEKSVKFFDSVWVLLVDIRYLSTIRIYSNSLNYSPCSWPSVWSFIVFIIAVWDSMVKKRPVNVGQFSSWVFVHHPYCDWFQFFVRVCLSFINLCLDGDIRCRSCGSSLTFIHYPSLS